MSMFEETNQAASVESKESQSTESETVENQDSDGSDMFGEEGEAESNTEDESTKSEGEEGENHSESTGDNKGEEGQKTDSEGKPTGTENIVPIKFNGQIFNVPSEAINALAKSMNISVEQAQVLMQKGMNYDHVKSEVDTDRETLEFYAKQNEMTVPQYMKALREQKEAAGIQAEVKALKDKFPDEKPELINMLAEMQFKQRQQDEADLIKRQEQSVQAKKDEQFSEFVKAYPDVKELPPEVTAKFNQGENLTSAYRAYENEMLKTKLANMEAEKKIVNKNQTNKETALGSLEGDNTNTERDPFMDGLNSI